MALGPLGSGGKSRVLRLKTRNTLHLCSSSAPCDAHRFSAPKWLCASRILLCFHRRRLTETSFPAVRHISLQNCGDTSSTKTIRLRCFVTSCARKKRVAIKVYPTSTNTCYTENVAEKYKTPRDPSASQHITCVPKSRQQATWYLAC